MKKEKKANLNPAGETISQWRARFALNRRKENRDREKLTLEMKRRQAFQEKLRFADEKKAPFTRRTRGYYRFTRDYPGTVDPDGCRENAPAKRRITGRRLAVVFSCILVFCLGYTLTKAGVYISEEPAASGPAQVEEEKTSSETALHFSYGDLSSGDLAQLTGALKRKDAQIAVFEFKDEYGYVMFGVGSFMGQSADRRIDSAFQTVRALKTAGYKTAAYISCFKDSVVPQADLSYAVRKNTEEGDYWTDNSGAGWLNPFSAAARNYILNLISRASAGGFDYIILDNVCFPTDAGTAQAVFPGENDYAGSRNQLLRGFISDAVNRAGRGKTVLLGKYTAFDPAADEKTAPYYGNLLDTSAGILMADARPSAQAKNITVGKDNFMSAEAIPFVFVLSVGEYAQSGVEKSGKSSLTALCVENAKSLPDQLDAAAFTDAKMVLIW